jgi:drug/metabolite transporter (DMT)-like permease
MMQASNFRQFLHLHIIVVLLGFTAILGALISLQAVDLVWYRMLFAFLGLLVYFSWRKIQWRIPLKKILPLLVIGIVVALHWITFFHAIKVSNVSVTLGVFASTTLFTSFLEPALQKRKVLWLEVFIGLVIIAGIYLIFQYEFQFIEGILYSLLSALLNGLFVVLNRNISWKHHPTVISFYEMIGGFLFISGFLLITGGFSAGFFSIPKMDIFWLLILSLVCTSYAFSAIVDIMKVLSAYTVVLSINLEPVYGIIMAFFFFPAQETMSAGFYAGASIIIVSVFSYPFLKRKFLSKALTEKEIS